MVRISVSVGENLPCPAFAQQNEQKRKLRLEKEDRRFAAIS
jgi:hypothetical protein